MPAAHARADGEEVTRGLEEPDCPRAHTSLSQSPWVFALTHSMASGKAAGSAVRCRRPMWKTPRVELQHCSDTIMLSVAGSVAAKAAGDNVDMA